MLPVKIFSTSNVAVIDTQYICQYFTGLNETITLKVVAHWEVVDFSYLYGRFHRLLFVSRQLAGLKENSL